MGIWHLVWIAEVMVCASIVGLQGEVARAGGEGAAKPARQVRASAQ